MKHSLLSFLVMIALGLAMACENPQGPPRAASPTPPGLPVGGTGKVKFVPTFEANSSWTGNTAAQDSIKAMLGQFEAVLSTGGTWDSTIEVYLNDDETGAGTYASAYSGSYHDVTYNGKPYEAVNSWAQIVQGLNNPNGVIDPTTGDNADIYVRWNFKLSSPASNPGLLRHELLHALGMTSSISKPTWKSGAPISKKGVGIVGLPTIHDGALVDAAGKSLWSVVDTDQTLNDYVVDSDFDDANGSGIVFRGIADNGSVLDMALTAWNPGATWDGSVDFAHVNIVSYANVHPSWNTVAEVDRAFLRGLGYTVGLPAATPAPSPTPTGPRLTSYSFETLPAYGVIDHSAKTIKVLVPAATSVKALTATFTAAATSVKVDSQDQQSGVTVLDFTSPVTYTLVAADGTTQSYQVTVTVEGPQPSYAESKEFGTRNWLSVASSADGTKLFAVDYNSNLFLSSDSGATWTENMPGRYSEISAVVCSADGTRVVALPEYGNIYTSGDSGATWTRPTGMETQVWDRISSNTDGTKLVATNTDGEVFTSANSGVSWTLRSGAGSRNWLSIAQNGDGSKILLVDNAFTGAYLYQSTDSGATWTTLTSAGKRRWTSVTSSSDGKICAASVLGGLLYTSTDAGASWTERTNQARDWYVISGSTDGTKLTAFVQGGGSFASVDSGATWAASNLPSGGWVSAASSSDGKNVVAVAQYGKLYVSTDSGLQWKEASVSGSRTWQAVASNTDGTSLVAVVKNGPLFTSTDAGATWTQRPSAGNRIWTSVASNADGSRLVAGTYQGSVYTSTDRGATWTEQKSAGAPYWIALASNAEGNVLAAVTSTNTGGSVMMSTDGGATWSEKTSAGNRFWSSVTLDSTGTKVAVTEENHLDNGSIFGGGSIYTSSDTGATWTERPWKAGVAYIVWRSISSSNDGLKLVAAARSGEVVTSSDGGATWTARTGAGSRSWGSVSMSADGSQIVLAEAGSYLATLKSLFWSTDGGATWKERTDAGKRDWISVALNKAGTKLIAAVREGGLHALR